MEDERDRPERSQKNITCFTEVKNISLKKRITTRKRVSPPFTVRIETDKTLIVSMGSVDLSGNVFEEERE